MDVRTRTRGEEDPGIPPGYSHAPVLLCHCCEGERAHGAPRLLSPHDRTPSDAEWELSKPIAGGPFKVSQRSSRPLLTGTRRCLWLAPSGPAADAGDASPLGARRLSPTISASRRTSSAASRATAAR